MPQSLAKITIHLVFSTKNCERLLADEVRDPLHRYLAGILRERQSPALEINTEPDHAHVLFALSRTCALSDIVGSLKQSSSLWLQKQTPVLRNFHWQAGYAAFSVSESSLENVREYIRKQREHHRRRSFQDEVRALFQRHHLEFDERYVWD